jgi:hypothetical protein
MVGDSNFHATNLAQNKEDFFVGCLLDSQNITALLKKITKPVQ